MSFNPVIIVAKKEKPEWYAATSAYARPDLRSQIDIRIIVGQDFRLPNP
jgi:hypothetical protein